MKKVATLAAICLMVLLISVEITAMNLIVLPVSRLWHVPLSQSQWIMSAYILAFGLFSMASGRLADRINRRIVLVTGIVLFIIGSWLGGAADTFGVLIAGRIIQGIAAAFIYPNLFALVYNEFAQKKGSAIGLMLGCTGFGTAFGPLLGGALAHWLGWRSVMYFNIPLSIIALVPLLLSWQHRQVSDDHSAQRSFWYNLQQLLPLKGFWFGCGLRAMTSFTYFALMYMLALFLQRSLHYSVWDAGLWFLPLTLAVGVFSPLGGRCVDAAGALMPGKWGLIGFMCAFVGVAVIAVFPSIIALAALLLLAGLSYGFLYPATVNIALSNVPAAQHGLASGLFTTINVLSKAMGALFCGVMISIFQQQHHVDVVALALPWILGVCVLLQALLVLQLIKRHSAAACLAS